MAKQTISMDNGPLKVYIAALFEAMKEFPPSDDVLHELVAIMSDRRRIGHLIRIEREKVSETNEIAIRIEPSHRLLELRAAVEARKADLTIVDIRRILDARPATMQ